MPGAFLDVGCPWSLLPAAPMTGDLVGLHSGECWRLRELSGSSESAPGPGILGCLVTGGRVSDTRHREEKGDCGSPKQPAQNHPPGAQMDPRPALVFEENQS